MGFLAYVIPVDGGGGHPDQGLPPGFGGRPDNSLPGGGPVDPGFGQGRPPGIWGPGQPGQPNRPGNALPGQPLPPHVGGRPPQGGGRPDQGLPQPGATPHGVAAATAPPAQVDPHNGAWVLVALGDGMVVWAWAQPQNVGGGGQPAQPDNTLPPTPPPTAGTPIPPAPQPKK